jgi:uncharacterized repeat protein (TIGR02543 family)
MTAPSGKTFDGWSAGGQNYAAGDSYTVTGNVTFTAQWTTGSSNSTTYTVSYDRGEGTGTAPYSQTVASGTSITLPTIGSMTAPSGKTFNGWSAGGQNYAAGDSYTVTGNVTFTAQWTTGSSSGTKPSTPIGVTATAQSSSSIEISWTSVSGASGYHVYRATSSSSSYSQIASPTTASYTNMGLSASTTYYYKVSAYNSVGESTQSSYTSATTSSSAPTTYTVTFNGNGASPPSSKTGNANSSITLPSITRSGYTFNGWYTSSSGGTRVGGAGASYTPSSNVTLYAQWSQSQPTQLATPTGLQTYGYSDDSYVQISWTQVPLAYTYEVYRSTSANGSYSKISVSLGEGTGSAKGRILATDSSPKNGTSYYKVKAIPSSSLSGSYTESNLSESVSITR